LTIRKFALVGDTHADANHRLDEHDEVMKWIAWDAKGRGAQALLHSGDVYERESTSRERASVMSWVACAAALMEVVIVAGNHDDPRDIDALRELRTVRPVHATSRPGPLLPLTNILEERIAWIAELPWPRKAYLVAGRQGSRAELDAMAVTELRNILRDYGRQFAGLHDQDLPRILLAHAMVRGSRVGPTQPPLVGADFELGLEDLMLVGADLCALGHIHLRQTWALDTGLDNVIYPGDPMPRNFGETDEKSYTLVTFDGRKLVDVQRILTPVPRMLHVSGGFEVVDGRGEVLLDAPVPENLENTEVRLRYEVKVQDRVAARAAAEAQARTMRAWGAKDVRIEEVVLVEQRARAPEVAAAKTGVERLRKHWETKGGEPARAAEIIAKFIELEADFREGVHRIGGLQFHTLAVDGIGPFRQRVFDFDQVDGQLIAVTGDNGAGKSTLLELLLGGVYRRCPTRGSLVDLATSRDASIVLELSTGGHAYRIKHLIDAVSRKSEAVILRDGVPAVEAAKVKAFDAYVEAHFPPLELQLVSSFAAQRSQGFIDTKPADRKALLLKIRGVELIQEMAGAARMHAASYEKQVDVRAARIEERKPAVSSANLKARRVQLDEQLAKGRELHAAERAKLQEAIDRNTEITEAEHRRARHVNDSRALNEQVQRRDQELANLRGRRAKWQALLDRAEQIHADAGAHERLTESLNKLDVEIASLPSMEEMKRRQAQLIEDMQSAQERIRKNHATVGDRAKVQRAAEELPGIREKLTMATNGLREAEAAQAELSGKQLLGAEGRIDALRGSLLSIRETHNVLLLHREAAEALHRDDKAREDAIEIPAQRKELEARVSGLRNDVDHFRRQEAAAVAQAARAELIEQAAQALKDAEADLERLQRDKAELLGAMEKRIKDERDMKLLRTEGAHQRIALAPAVEEKAELRGAAEEAQGLDQLIASAEAELTAAREKLTALGPPPPLQARPNLTGLQATVTQLELELKEHEKACWTNAERISQTEEAEAAIASMSELQADDLLELSDWQRLAADLGKDGLQAALSDAVIPELVALTNTLLHSAFGPRFTVDVRSQVADSTGKKMLETLEVWVIDTAAGRDAPIETFSGGEATIIGEALSLALTVLACRSSDGTPPTLVRDEAGAALSGSNAIAWINMLRRAVEMIGADKLLFVSHSPAVTALADGRIEL
jgi:DNA repair exonuclease SbcCD ATPase subunit/DNA repair exonuclease SbcCD nuclease subunit